MNASNARPNQPPPVLQLLAHPLRWTLFRALGASDYRVQELATHVREPMNLVSYHLKKMREDALVSARRSEADSRDIYYSLDLDRLRTLFYAAGGALHPALAASMSGSLGGPLPATRVLFVCTHNSARSQMAEGLLRTLTGGSVVVTSAGSHPTRVHPDAIRAMDELGIDISQQEARHLSAYAEQPFDYVVTVCDKAREVCPRFPGKGVRLHWGLADPLAIEEADRRAVAFERTAQQLKTRIGYFLTQLAAGTQKGGD
ncbi:MAG: helix-turn-helix domain-containing protein [Anaerolineae bacterium]|nr:helix-turn-helix domain-containing protein [Anaerolineae bacterium]